MGPLQKIKSKLSRTEDLKLIKLAQDNANNLLHLVNQVLDLSKLESNNVRLQASPIDIIPFLKGLFYTFESLAKNQNIYLSFSSSRETFDLYCDHDKMQTIMNNILSNAVKFSNEGGEIALDVSQIKNRCVIKITDSGIGISRENIPQIFNRFFQSEDDPSDKNKGSGVSLALVKELVHLHHGTVEVQSIRGQGTSFLLSFPMGKTHLSTHELYLHNDQDIHSKTSIDSSELDHLTPSYSVINTKSKSKNKEVILIIEDNNDVRSFIKSQLDSSYKVEEAQDGIEGIEKSIEILPDLIISDIMMPGKDGYEVCHYLKNDIRTSHIPIILLTAKSAREEKLEGLHQGADDYLIKPFDSEELEVRVRNLIALRKQLRTRFSKSIAIKPSEVSTNSMDQQFMKNALYIVEKHMADENFNIDIMTREIGMSATQLNHKLRSLIDKSTNQFIKSIRLQRAADLLAQDTGTISEIAFQTGFRSSAYFAASFKSHFGATPKLYKEKNKLNQI